MLWVILLFASVSLYGRSLLTHLMTRLSSYVASVELFQNCLSVASFELFHTKTALFPSGHNSLVAFVSVATHYISNVVWQQFQSVTALPMVGRPWLMAVCVSKLCVCLQFLLGFRTNKETYWSNGVWKGVVCGGRYATIPRCWSSTVYLYWRCGIQSNPIIESPPREIHTKVLAPGMNPIVKLASRSSNLCTSRLWMGVTPQTTGKCMFCCWSCLSCMLFSDSVSSWKSVCYS